MYALAAIGLFVSFGVNWITWLVRYRLLLTCLLTGTVFSVAWSVDTALSLERSTHLIGTTILALYLGFSLPLTYMLRTSAVVLGFIMIASVIVALLVPDLGLQEYEGTLAWAGVLASKNTLGFWAAITFLLCTSLSVWNLPGSQRLFHLAVAAVSLLCLYNSLSATSLLALISGGLIILYLHTAFNLRLSMLAMVFLGGLVVSLVGLAFYFIDTAELIGRSGDLTGRGEVWAQTWQLILERPLTGYGYGTLWYPTPESLWIQKALTDFTWTVYHAHNGFLQIASEIGLPLTVLAFIMIVQQLIEIIYCQYQRQQPGVLFVMGFTVALLISNYSEARLLGNRDLYWIFFIALPVSMLRQISVKSLHIRHSPGTANSAFKIKAKHIQTQERKAYKQNLKERLKQNNVLKIINPVQTDSAVDNIKHVDKDHENSVQPSDDHNEPTEQQARQQLEHPIAKSGKLSDLTKDQRN